jgi:hypothetical protein
MCRRRPTGCYTTRNHSLDHAEHAELRVALDDDRLQSLVGRLELDAILLGPVVLHGRFFTDERDDDLPRVRPVLLTHHDVVAVVNAGVDHAVTADTQREQTIRITEQIVRVEPAVEVFFGERRLTRGDATEHRIPAGANVRCAVLQLDAARALARALHEATLLEHLQVVANPVGRVDLERLTDLADRGRIPVVAREALDVRQDFSARSFMAGISGRLPLGSGFSSSNLARPDHTARPCSSSRPRRRRRVARARASTMRTYPGHGDID